MNQYKLKTGKGELNSTGGNHLLGLLLEDHARQAIPVNFQSRRSDAIADRHILLTQIGLLCAMIAFNLLRTLGQEVLQRAALAPQKIKVSRWRIKTVLQNIIYCAVRLVRNAERIELHFGKHCPWFTVIRDIAFACT